MKFLVFTTDIIPLPGLPTSGTALRTHGIIEGLRCHGHEVFVSVPRNALQGLKKSKLAASAPKETIQELAGLEDRAFDARNQSDLINRFNPDVILCGHWPALTLSVKPSQAVVIDLAGPHMLERHYQGMPNQQSATLGKLRVLRNADFFIASGKAQRLYFLSFLLRAKIHDAEKRIAKITMPLSPDLPPERSVRDTESFPHFVFGGIFLPWQDPSLSLTQLSKKLATRNKGKLTLIGGRHPNYKIKQGIYTELFKRLAENPRVATQPMLPYEDFIKRITECDIAIDLMRRNLERELALTIRSTTYLWAGLPVIYNNYSDLSTLINQYNAGWCIPPDSEPALEEVLEEIYKSPDLVAAKSKNARELAKQEFRWDHAVQPLLDIFGLKSSQPLMETDIILDFPEEAMLQVTRDSSIEQEFTCRLNGLSRIEFRLATHNGSPTSVKASLLQSGEQQQVEISSTEFSPSEIINNEWHVLELPPLEDSAGKDYLLKLSSEELQPQHCVSPWICKGSPYPMKKLVHGSTAIRNSALCFRTTCTNS